MRRLSPLFALCLAACLSKPQRAAVAPPALPAPAPQPVAALPPGASPGMNVPAPLADGSFPTPNRGLSPAGALWHLRGGLNVAALACRGVGEAETVSRYNALLANREVPLAAAQRALEAEYRLGNGADWQARWDSAMTRLYNYYSQTPVRTEFCSAAAAILAELEQVPDAELPTFAAVRIVDLDRPFTAFYRAYDAWRRQAVPPSSLAPLTYAAAAPRARPWLTVDPAVLRTP